MGECFNDLGQDRRFHDRTAHGTGGGMPWIFQAGQIAERADIGEIDLRGLDEPLADVGEIGSEYDHLVGGFQHRQPGLDRVHGNTEVPGQIGQVEELRGARRQGPEKALELSQIAYLAEGTYISLQVGLDVSGMPEGDVASGVCDQLRVAAPQEVPPDIPIRSPRTARVSGLLWQSGVRVSFHLAAGEWKQAEYCRAPGQGFGDLFGEQEILEAREEVLAGPLAVGIDLFLHVG